MFRRTPEREEELRTRGFGAIWDSLQVYMPFLEMNCVYDNTRLKEELGDDMPDCPKFTDYLNEMIAMIDPNLVSAASDELSSREGQAPDASGNEG